MPHCGGTHNIVDKRRLVEELDHLRDGLVAEVPEQDLIVVVHSGCVFNVAIDRPLSAGGLVDLVLAIERGGSQGVAGDVVNLAGQATGGLEQGLDGGRG